MLIGWFDRPERIFFGHKVYTISREVVFVQPDWLTMIGKFFSKLSSWRDKSPVESLVLDHIFGVLIEIQLFFGTCVVYTKTIVYLGVLKSGGSLPHLCSKRSNMDIQG